MIDAAANDALDALEACPCCLLGPQQRCLKTPYTHLDNMEIYSDMLRECFSIQLDVASDTCGICEACVVRLRDASHFKRQVQRSQAQLHERLARALKLIEEEPPVTVKLETADEDRTSDNLSGDEPDVNSEAADDDGTSGASSASLNEFEFTALDTTCSVSLDQVCVDTEHRTCRVGSQTYKLSLYSRSPRPVPEGKGNNSRKSTRSNLKNAEMETAGERKASVSRQVSSVTNEDVGEMPAVKHSKTANITKGTTLYKCSRCSYANAFKSHLLRHERKHTGEKPFKCSHCSYASAHKCNLLLHERKHTGEKPYKCSHCSFTCPTKSYLLVHERKHTGEKPYKCNRCSYANAFKSHLLRHERKHTGEKPYKCSHCSFTCSTKSYLLVHERKHRRETIQAQSLQLRLERYSPVTDDGHTSDSNRVPFVPFGYETLKIDKSRLFVAGNLKNAEMETAGEQKASVSRQVSSVTNEDVGEMPAVKHSKTANITKGTTLYKCSRCSYANAFKSHLLRHERKHTGEKPYKCSHCSYASAHKYHLLLHERKHTGEKPYKCSHCSFTCPTKSYLLVHERKHTGEKPYKCNHCSYANAFKSHLLRHERKHTGEKPYKCSHCSFTCTTKSYLLVHERKHTGEKPFKCSHCSFTCTTKSNLLVHERKHRRETIQVQSLQLR